MHIVISYMIEIISWDMVLRGDLTNDPVTSVFYGAFKSNVAALWTSL